MDFRKLRHAVAIDQAGSFTVAAETLNITQSALTRSIAELEAELGFALFERHARGARVRHEGRDILNRAARLVSDFDHFTEEARGLRNDREAVLRIGVAPPSIEGLLNRAIASVVSRYPSCRVHLSSQSAEAAARSLQRGDLDILVCPTANVQNDDELVLEEIGALEAQLFVRQQHPLAGRNRIDVKSLSRYPIIAPDLAGPYRSELDRLAAKGGRSSAASVHVIENFAIIAMIVARTDSVALVHRGYARSASFRRRFAVIDVDYFNEMPLCAARVRQWLPTMPMKSFVATLRENWAV